MSKRNRILATAAAGILSAVFIVAGILRGWFCGPSTCGLGSWLYDYQNLIAGLLAFGAGAFVLVAARSQFWWEKSKWDAEARDRSAEVNRERRAIMHAAQFEYIQRAKELEDLVDSLIADTDGALATNNNGAEAASGPIRARASVQVRESILRCRGFCASTHKELIKLDTSDHVQHRLSLIKLEAALVEIETFLHAIEHLGGPGAGVLVRLKDGLPKLRASLTAAMEKLPTKENPTPFEVPPL